MSQPVENNAPEGNEGATTETSPESGQATGSQENGSQKLSYEQLESELSRVRHEAASRRVALREQEAAAKKWQEYEESQKTELQKLQDQLAEREKALAAKDNDILRNKIAREFNVADEDLDLLVGDEENMKRLATRLGQKSETPSNTPPTDLLAGNRGKPVGNSQNTFSVDNWIRGR